MLRTNLLKQKLANKVTVYGIICSIPSPSSIEIIGEAGFDFVIIDMEHVMVNPETVENMIRTAEIYQLTPLVRVADFNPKTMLRLLDAGAQGLVLPMIENAQDVQDAVAACKYHPIGKRSLNAGRPGAFGKNDLTQYAAQANEETMLVAMIESMEGVNNANAIMSVPELDMVLEGGADLSQSCGHPWETSHTDVLDALHQCQLAAKESHVPYCAIPRRNNDHQYWLDKGVQAFVLGDERGTAFRALEQKLASVKNELKENTQ